MENFTSDVINGNTTGSRDFGFPGIGAATLPLAAPLCAGRAGTGSRFVYV